MRRSSARSRQSGDGKGDRGGIARQQGRGARAGASALGALIVGLGLGACSTGKLQPVTPVAVDAGRAAGIISAYRSSQGLGRVTVESRLMDAARSYARVMGQTERVNHRIGGSLAKRVTAAGYDWGAVAENLAAGQTNLDVVFDGWKASAGHRQNLLNPLVTEIGIAAVTAPSGFGSRNYWALILATPRPERAMLGPFAMGVAR
jgi:uncharacterized protein YkwD